MEKITDNVVNLPCMDQPNFCEGHDSHETQYLAKHKEPREHGGFEWCDTGDLSLCDECFEDALLEEIKDCQLRLDSALAKLEGYIFGKRDDNDEVA